MEYSNHLVISERKRLGNRISEDVLDSKKHIFYYLFDIAFVTPYFYRYDIKRYIII